MASEYLRWLYRDEKRDAPLVLTPAERRKNWWHYHKWHVILGVAAVLIAADLACHAAAQVHPDYQVAYVGSVPLSEAEEAAWESRLAALGTDCNGDGSIVVELHQYLSAPEDAMYHYASNVQLMADLDACESYFFLLEDPEGFQAGYEVLQEDWFPVEEGLYLARRAFWEHRVPKNMQDCGLLWEQLAKEAS